MEIFHGGCHGCTNQDFFGLDECLGCQYYPVDGNCRWDRPNNFSDVEIRKIEDPDISGKYYALKFDEKIVHYKAGYERNINGEVFEPHHTKIVKKNNIYEVVWDSRDEKLPSYEIEHTEIQYMGKTIRMPSHNSMVIQDNSGSVSVAEWIEPAKEFGG